MQHSDPPAEFTWLQEVGDQIPTSYDYKWIAIDGQRIASALRPEDAIVAASADLAQLFATVGNAQRDAALLYYSYLRPVLSQPNRSESRLEVESASS
jgi:hypothetical protein